MTSWVRKWQKRKREKETLEETYARVMRAESVINLGIGPLLAPTDKPLSRERTSEAIKQMIRVAETGRFEDECREDT